MSNFSKRNLFLHLKILINFILFIECDTFEPAFFFFLAALCKQPIVVLCHWRRYRERTFKRYINPLWTIGFSIVTYTKLWWSVKDLHKNALKKEGTRFTVDILRSDRSLVFFLIYWFCFPSFNWQSNELRNQ